MDDFKYLAITEWVKNYIEDERLSPGDKFYSEKELCDIHNVSRQTVRQALMVLEGQNVIWRKRGSGTFVGVALLLYLTNRQNAANLEVAPQ